MNATKFGKPLPEKKLIKRMSNIKKDMFLYSPDDAFKTFTKWTLVSNKNENLTTHFKICFEVM